MMGNRSFSASSSVLDVIIESAGQSGSYS